MTTTFDPAKKSSLITLSNGDLTTTGPSTSTLQSVASTTSNTTGKFYCEFTITVKGTQGSEVGIANSLASFADNADFANDSANGYAYWSGGNKIHNGSFPAYGATFTDGDIISVLLDIDGGTLEFWKNGASQGVAYTGIAAGSWFPAIGSASNSATPSITANFGATAWAYTPTAGYNGWAPAPPTPGTGSGTIPAITGYGARVAAGAGVLPHIGGSGGYNGIGAGTLPAIHGAGTGGHNGGVGTLAALTATGTGHQAHYGAGVLGAVTAVATGHDSSINTVAATVPAVTLSSSVITGEVITFEGAIPAITLECGTKDARLTVPAPTLSATLLSGTLITVTARVAAPVLVATLDNPAIITAACTVAAPRLSAALLSGNVATAVLELRAPRLSAQILTGNVATVLATIAAPTMEAAGYPAFTITFAGTMPAPRLNATLSAAVVNAYRTWVANVRKGALTEYGPEWAMNSYAVFNGKVLGCTSGGVVELGTQALDNATAISSTITTGKDAFGSSVLKRVPRIYVGHSTTGDLQFATITTEGGTRRYALDWNRVTGIQQRRVPVGKGPKSRYWQFSVTNVDGADFDLSDILVYPQALRRRVQ